jgi:PKD repeat protein
MKRALLLLFPALLLAFAGLSGCDDESKPAFTRLTVYPDCGVMPLQVEGLAIVSGGNESGSPTGGNNNLEIQWNFGDGGSSQTSIAYHTFEGAGEYLVQVTATDPDGNKATASYPVTVYADSLFIEALSTPAAGTVPVNTVVSFDVTAESCDIDPMVEGDFVKLAYRWDFGDRVFNDRQITRRWTTPGTYEVFLAVTDPALSVTRRDTLVFTVTDP